jgi:hypothetical protein
MIDERKKILEMLANGKISVDEAERLIAALSENSKNEQSTAGKSNKFNYLRVLVEESGPNGERVNIRVPLSLIRSGLKWASLIPSHAKSKVDHAFHEKGIDMDFNNMTKEDIEDLISNLGELTVDVEGKEKVKVFCE